MIKFEFRDLVGKKFNKLLCKELHHKDKSGRVYFVWLCDCGKERVIMASSVYTGKTKSCGCIRDTSKFTLPSGEASFNSVYNHYMKGALRRLLEFSLTKEQFKSLTKRDCVYCGVEPKQTHVSHGSKTSYTYNGVDRKDNKVGYIIENSVPCCGECNWRKGSSSYAEFLSWMSRVVDFNTQITGATYASLSVHAV